MCIEPERQLKEIPCHNYVVGDSLFTQDFVYCFVQWFAVGYPEFDALRLVGCGLIFAHVELDAVIGLGVVAGFYLAAGVGLPLLFLLRY